MKDLLSKDHYCYKIHKFLMTTVLTSCSIGNPHYGLYPVFTRKSLPPPLPPNPLFYDFSKISTLYK